jgi:hypothetical protein
LGIAGAALPAQAAPDPAQLTTSLTFLGTERAGNADGSIPAWTGGLSAPALPAGQPIDVKLFTDEAPLVVVSANNVAQYEKLLTPGTLAMVRKFDFRLKLYATRRTAAAPQYVYDNTAKNVTRSRLEPRGGQLGFTGGFGGVPFPVIDTQNPLTGGAQLIWNHLTSWRGVSRYSKFAPSFVVADGRLALSVASVSRNIYPYYDPGGSPDVYAGYFGKEHLYYKIPTNVQGEEKISWFSTDPETDADITWYLLNGQGRVHKVPDPEKAYAASNPAASAITALDEYSCFDGTPAQYDWRYLGKQEMLVPYNCNAMHFAAAQDVLGVKFPNPDIVRWEKYRVWVVEAVLRSGATNALARRRLYIDEDSWLALLGEAYDASGALIKYHTTYNRCIPSLPATCKQGSLVFDLTSGNYVYAGGVGFGTSAADEFAGPQPSALFDPEEMCARCSF